MAEREAVLLEGGCDCGRNQYTVQVPSRNVSEELKIRFDGSSTSLRAYSSPASVFLRVPLEAIQSTTYAYYPDETHAQIRRSYTSRHMPSSKKFFCGMCSELLSVWTEDESEAGHINVNWHTLERESKETVDGLGILPSRAAGGRSREGSGAPDPAAAASLLGDSDAEHVVLANDGSAAEPRVSQLVLRTRGLPWYEEILQGSALGRLRKRKGVGVSADGTARVEWEVVEYYDNDGGDEEGGERRTSKRQHLSKGDERDEAMGGVPG